MTESAFIVTEEQAAQNDVIPAHWSKDPLVPYADCWYHTCRRWQGSDGYYRREADRLRAALLKYGQHHFECSHYGSSPPDIRNRVHHCVCGLSDALTHSANQNQTGDPK